jgi:hypothetical protein
MRLKPFAGNRNPILDASILERLQRGWPPPGSASARRLDIDEDPALVK